MTTWSAFPVHTSPYIILKERNPLWKAHVLTKMTPNKGKAAQDVNCLDALLRAHWA